MTGSDKRQELIMSFYPMIRKIAFRMSRNFPAHIEVDDLMSIGLIGLIEAIDKYNPETSPAFSTYARIRIQGAILDEMRHMDWVPRSVRDRASRINNATAALKQKLNRSPSEEELAKYMGIESSELEHLRKRADVRVILSMEEGSQDERRLGDSIPSHESTPQDQIIDKQNVHLMKSLIETLPAREQQVIKMYYYSNLTFKDIAEMLGVTESRISQIHSGIRKKLQKASKKNQFDL